jgi:two-component system, cell cycle sensor histidine kinase and response regulator CckA
MGPPSLSSATQPQPLPIREPANRRVMRQFLTTPIFAGTFLFCCGLLRGFGRGADTWRSPIAAALFIGFGLIFVVVVLRTIRRLFREVLDTKDHLGSIIGSMNDSLFVVDSEGRIAMANQTALEYLGYAELELKGKPAGELFLSAKNNPISRSELQTLSHELVRDLEAALLAKGGKRIPVLVSAAKLRDSTGREVGMVCVARDISERKKAEEEANRAQLQLMQASKLASLGTIGSGVAHEIKNPLTIVKASAGLILRSSKASRSIKSEAAEIIRCSERIHKITDHLLTFARETRQEDWKQLDVNGPIRDSLILLKAKLRGQEIKLKLTLAPTLPKIHGDSSQLESVFQNLLTNSLDAFEGLPSDRPKHIQITTSEPEPGIILVVYEDDASGIPAEIVDRVFDPFFTTKAVGKGTGLGMSIIHGIVQKHRGTIKLDTEVGRGTKFTFQFPADARAAAETPKARAPKRPAAKAEKLTGPAPQVLIIDDEPRIAELLKLMLGKGFNATVMTDSRQARDLIEKKPFDVVITDLQMPHVSGHAILQKVKQCQPSTPVVLMTGYGEADPKVKKALEEGAFGVLDKPFSDPGTVRSTLLGFLTASRAAKRKKAA